MIDFTPISRPADLSMYVYRYWSYWRVVLLHLGMSQNLRAQRHASSNCIYHTDYRESLRKWCQLQVLGRHLSWAEQLFTHINRRWCFFNRNWWLDRYFIINEYLCVCIQARIQFLLRSKRSIFSPLRKPVFHTKVPRQTVIGTNTSLQSHRADVDNCFHLQHRIVFRIVRLILIFSHTWTSNAFRINVQLDAIPTPKN